MSERFKALVGDAGNCEKLSRDLAEDFDAEASLVVSVDLEKGKLKIECGFSQSQGGPLLWQDMQLKDVPRLASALQRDRAVRLLGAERHADLEQLNVLLGLEGVESLMAVPISSPPKDKWAVILLRGDAPWQLHEQEALAEALEKLEMGEDEEVREGLEGWPENDFEVQRPFAAVFDEDDFELGVADSRATPAFEAEAFEEDEEGGSEATPAFDPEAFDEDEAGSQPVPAFGLEAFEEDAAKIPAAPPFGLEEEGGKAEERRSVSAFGIDELEDENEKYRKEIARLLDYIDRIKGKDSGSGEQKSNGYGQEASLIEKLRSENQELKKVLGDMDRSPRLVTSAAGIDAQQAKEELRLALEEVASLHVRLEAAQQTLMEIEGREGGHGKMPAEKAEVIASVAQELRQPLTSILGYTDLLLGESVGILGALQRSFLMRVRSSTERMNTLIEDLIQIAELDLASFELRHKSVELSEVMDEVIHLVRKQLHDKGIALRVDLPARLPKLQTDRDALQQILFHLLQNADAATPAEGEVSLRAIVEQEDELGEFILLQVSDTGGGIPEEDLPRVFSRMYRSENPLIEGVGDTGVGLTIAETLTQALGGRIWVETEEGVGATFSVLLPLQAEIQYRADGAKE